MINDYAFFIMHSAPLAHPLLWRGLGRSHSSLCIMNYALTKIPQKTMGAMGAK